MRLLGGDEMTASGGEHVSPPMPGGDQEQDGNKNRMGRKEKRYLAIRETKRPRDLRRQVVASGAGENPEHACGDGALFVPPPSAVMKIQLGIHFWLHGFGDDRALTKTGRV